MPANKVVLLACGSFNPVTNMHLRMFEIAKDHLHRIGNSTVVGGLVSPVHDGYGKADLASSTHRLEMLRLALRTSDWIKLSDWEIRQETWTKTRATLQYHQNHINSVINLNNGNENELNWLPDNLRNGMSGPVQVKLLCGGDLLESFGTPGLWADEDIEAIVGQHGLVVITRENTNPLKFIYNSDILTRYMGNITIITEWIRNEVSSTKIRRALRRSESIKYLIPDNVIDYIQNNGLYGATNKNKYLLTPFTINYDTNFLTPSPTDVSMESPTANITTRCMNLCNNNIFSPPTDSTTVVDGSVTRTNQINNALKLPGQAVKIITGAAGDHKIIKDAQPLGKEKEVIEKATVKKSSLKSSKSCVEIPKIEVEKKADSKSTESLECKSCDENLIKFIFTKHGIQVISDVETIV